MNQRYHISSLRVSVHVHHQALPASDLPAEQFFGRPAHRFLLVYRRPSHVPVTVPNYRCSLQGTGQQTVGEAKMGSRILAMVA